MIKPVHEPGTHAGCTEERVCLAHLGEEQLRLAFDAAEYGGKESRSGGGAKAGDEDEVEGGGGRGGGAGTEGLEGAGGGEGEGFGYFDVLSERGLVSIYGEGRRVVRG